MTFFEVQVLDQIDEYIIALDMAVETGLAAGCAQVVALAQGAVRQDTLSLHDTIDAESVINGAGIHEWSVNAGNVEGGYKGGSQMNSKPPGAPVDYAIEQEYGGGESPNTPYMTPAAESGWPMVQESITLAIVAASGG